jgi:DNA-binding CsgD family transcriptional regulator
MSSYKEQYYSLQENEMQDLIDKAKKGSGHHQEELLKVFSNFLTKYTSLLYYSKFNLNDYDIRRFISLFIKDPGTRFALMKNKLNQNNTRVINECMRGINYMARRYGDEEDIRQTINLTFFQCINRYERKDSAKGPIPFSGFLYSYFFYLLKKNVDTFLIDQLGRKTFPLLSDDATTDESDENYVVGFKADPVEYSLEQMLSTDKIDEFWVLGEKNVSPFDRLSVQERQLLKWRYVDGERSSEISLKINEHPNTIREHLTKIKNKVRDLIIELEIDEYAILLSAEKVK